MRNGNITSMVLPCVRVSASLAAQLQHQCPRQRNLTSFLPEHLRRPSWKESMFSSKRKVLDWESRILALPELQIESPLSRSSRLLAVVAAGHAPLDLRPSHTYCVLPLVPKRHRSPASFAFSPPSSYRVRIFCWRVEGFQRQPLGRFRLRLFASVAQSTPSAGP
ncbi:hypothetical protein B0J12DRAFT_94497 [Macrophomina phaseolina]|uniref:Uncharacterized protein n=1 Tax=Macrophomina phaseolina TaxID=35725 RepID=A0ABQ8FPI0_9PEZI|nr:hypothetical protein B0J12DRAFT_94497 [Macrophomina phaseolina]